MVFKFPSEIDPTTLKVIEDRQLQQEQLDRIGLNQSVIETYCGIAGKTDLDVALQLAVNPAAEVARLAAEREKELALGGSGQAVRELADALGGETALRETLRAIEEQPRIDALKILGESTDPMQQLREMAERHRAEQQVLAVPLFDPMEAHRRHEQRKREFDIETARLAEIERQRVIDEAEAARGARSSSTTLAEPVAPKETKEERQDRRLQMCIDAGLKMPTCAVGRMPDGIGKVAEEMAGVKRQTFVPDVRAALKRKIERERPKPRLVPPKR